MLARPDRRPGAADAAPEPVDEAGAVRLHDVAELLDAAAARRGADDVAAHEVAEAQEAVGAEVLLVEGVGVDRVAVEVEVHRRARREAGVQAAAEQHVDRAEVLREAERVLGADRRDGGAELDAAGALRRGRHDRDGGRDAGLQVPVPQPRAVEAELLAALDDAQRVLVAAGRGRGVERPDREEAEALQRGTVYGHAPSLAGAAAPRASSRRRRGTRQAWAHACLVP